MTNPNHQRRARAALPASPVVPFRISDLIPIVRQRWPIGLAIGLFLAAGVAYYLVSQPAQYRAFARLVVEINPDKMIELGDVVTGGSNYGIYDTIMNTYLERLQSRTMAEFVLEAMTDNQLDFLARRFPNADTLVTEEGREIPRVEGVLLQSVRADWRSDAQIVTIAAVNEDPKVAQIVANGYSRALIQLQSSRIEERTAQTLEFLDSQSKVLEQRLETGEADLQKYRSEKNLLSIEGSIDVVAQRIGQLNGALTTQQMALVDARDRIKLIDKCESNTDCLVGISFVAERPRINQLLAELDAAKYERETLGKTYLRRHPLMIENASRIESLESGLKQLVETVVATITKEWEVLQTSYDSLLSEVKKAEAEALELDRLAIDYRVLQRKLDVQGQIFDLVSEQLTATDVSSQFDMASIRVLDPALLPAKPFAPDPKQAVAVSVVLFLGCFIGIPVVMELLDNRLKSFHDIEVFVGKPVFGDIKQLQASDEILQSKVSENNENKGDLQESGVVEESEDYPELAESFQAIYSSLKLATSNQPPYCLIVTSSIPSEGKTFVSCNVGETFSRHQRKVILIDCDFRRPSVHRYFNLKNEAGVISWIRSERTLATGQEILEDESLGVREISEGFYVLPSGGSTREPTEVIDHPRFDELISRLKSFFDVVIFDTPPVGVFPDACLLAEYAGQTLFVAKQNDVTRPKARFAVSRLEATNAPVAGVVLNFITGYSVATGYGHYSHSDSYSYGYYGDKKDYRDEYRSSSSKKRRK